MAALHRQKRNLLNKLMVVHNSTVKGIKSLVVPIKIVKNENEQETIPVTQFKKEATFIPKGYDPTVPYNGPDGYNDQAERW